MKFRESLVRQSAEALRTALAIEKATASYVEKAERFALMSALGDDQLLRSSLFGNAVAISDA